MRYFFMIESKTVIQAFPQFPAVIVIHEDKQCSCITLRHSCSMKTLSIARPFPSILITNTAITLDGVNVDVACIGVNDFRFAMQGNRPLREIIYTLD
jgi:hypothetical protein